MFCRVNPSFNEKKINKVLLDQKINANAISVFDFEKYKANKSIINGIDIKSIKHYSYFKTLKEFADENMISFSYFDLFLIRCSRQEELLNHLNDEIKSGFFRSQPEFFVKAISLEVKNSLTYSLFKCLKLLKFPDKAFTDDLKRFKEYYCPLNRFTRSKFKNNLKELLKNDL